MMWWHDDWTWWGWLAMTISMLAFWAMVVIGVVWAIRSIQTGSTPARVDARDILRERFARGEITDDEFRRAMSTLHEADHGRWTGRGTGVPPADRTGSP
jgi:putative membrane protein